MNSQKSGNTMTQLKNQIQQKNRRKYCNSRQQKTLNFYQLYRQQIVKIQRWYRSKMAAVNIKKQTLLLAKIHKHESLLEMKQKITDKLMTVSARRAFLMENKQNQALTNMQKEIEVKLRKVISGTLQRTEESALCNGKTKYALQQIKNLRQHCEQKQGEVQALRFEYECFLKRRQQWEQKLKSIKTSINNENLKTKQIKAKISQIQTHLMLPKVKNTGQILIN